MTDSDDDMSVPLVPTGRKPGYD
eukprot:COSAG05_NODE_25095_length_198_cov_44.484848_1_plen_22_part_10